MISADGPGHAPAVGAMFSPLAAVTDLVAFADGIDALGYDELWLAEDCFAHGGISAAAVAVTRMRHAAVGIGLLPAVLRNPALVAMELATLAHLYPGRVRAAFGHGVEEWMEQVGARPPDRIALLREVTGAVARLLDGQEVTGPAGAVALDRVRLDRPPARAPELLIGTTGERGMQVARDLGVGLLLPEGSSAEAVRRVRNVVPTGRLTVYCWLSIDEDEQAAREALLPIVRRWSDRGLYPRLAAFAGVPAGQSITADSLTRLAVVGTAERCAQSVQALRDAGADAVILAPIAEDPLAALTRFGRDVLPWLRGPTSAPRSPVPPPQGTVRRS